MENLNHNFHNPNDTLLPVFLMGFVPFLIIILLVLLLVLYYKKK